MFVVSLGRPARFVAQAPANPVYHSARARRPEARENSVLHNLSPCRAMKLGAPFNKLFGQLLVGFGRSFFRFREDFLYCLNNPFESHASRSFSSDIRANSVPKNYSVARRYVRFFRENHVQFGE